MEGERFPPKRRLIWREAGACLIGFSKAKISPYHDATHFDYVYQTRLSSALCRLLHQDVIHTTMIELGLARIIRLLKGTPIQWRAIHVAGTNGKGSVCAYVSAMLHAGKIKCGRFTSPHLIDRWDCITIDEEPVHEDLFREVEGVVKARDYNEGIKASEFELLTATAFEIFNREKIEIGVVEVGMGGRHDATNVIDNPSVTVITKIGLDHQSFLGRTLEHIAYQKAGIMKNGVPCIVDGSNSPSVIEVLRKSAKEIGAASINLAPQDYELEEQVWSIIPKDHFEEHQQMNIYLAVGAVQQMLSREYTFLDLRSLLPSIQETIWPGRLQRMSIDSLVGREYAILLDGAHNTQSAKVLGSYVDRKLRKDEHPVTWVVAMSKGKDVYEVLSRFLRPKDIIITVGFSPVDGMPWVSSETVEDILHEARRLNVSDLSQKGPEGIVDALRLATVVAKGGPLVVAGSLYLVSDVLRSIKISE